ncbi:hypothetical protein AB0E06_10195 [Streptomyces sp. NPDC048109]|uniref:hypothetical protein n=1 Tax=Streptomyces sp. NPDC048109 TaxID=3155482 RepID=UPI0034441AA9
MSTTPSRDARAVVAAVDRLTTQVKRLADAQSTPVAIIRDGVTTPLDAPTTTTDDGPCAQHPDAPTIGGLCGGCTQYPADFPARETPSMRLGRVSVEASIRDHFPAADEDAQRATRREQLHNLLARLDHGGLLSPGDCTRLRVLVDTEVRAADTARAAFAHLAGTYKAERRRGDALAEERNQAWAERDAEQARLRDLLRSESQRGNKAIDREATAEQAAEETRAELEQAQAALERVRALLDSHLGPLATAAVRRALDGTNQPAGCPCHTSDERCSGCGRCPDACHGCDG